MSLNNWPSGIPDFNGIIEEEGRYREVKKLGEMVAEALLKTPEDQSLKLLNNDIAQAIVNPDDPQSIYRPDVTTWHVRTFRERCNKLELEIAI